MSDKEKWMEIVKRVAGRCLPSCTGDFHISMLVTFLLAQGVTVQEWHPASEPPKKGGAYYVHTKSRWGGSVGIAEYTPCYDGIEEKYKGEKMWYRYDSEYGDYMITDVAHWMPLPQPPKEE